MSDDVEQIHVHFHRRARKAFFSLLEDFEHRAATMGRVHAENHYQQFKGQYIDQLRHQLHDIAGELIGAESDKQKQHHLSHSLADLIAAYLENFRQKCNY